MENMLVTLVSAFLGNVGDLSAFVLCPTMFMPSLARLGLTEWKQFEPLIFYKMGWQH